MKNIRKYTYPFATGNLKVTTLSDLSDDVKADIGFLIRIVENQLNPKVLDSSAYKIKNSQIGFETIVEEEMIVYLKFCQDLEKNFGITTLSRESEEFPVSINEVNMSVKKIQEFTFLNEDLKKYFLLNMIKVFLFEKKVKDFLIETSVLKFSTANKSLKANFEVDGLDSPLELAINGWSYLYQIKNQNKETKSKFAYHPTSVNISQVIYISQDFLEIFKAREDIASFNTMDELHAYRKSTNFAFILIDDKKEILYF